MTIDVVVINDTPDVNVEGGSEEVAIIEVSEQGPQGPRGPTGLPGHDGRTLLYGSTDPPSDLGQDDDFYINTTTSYLFGPKNDGVWPVSASLVGDTGPRGPGIIYGTAAPDVGDGFNGDFYFRTTTNFLYGPKAGGVWPAGISLVGPQGAKGDTGLKGDKGDTGATGAAGVPLGTKANIIINPRCEVSQENGSSSVSLATGTAKYIIDGFNAAYAHAANTAVIAAAQSSGSGAGLASALSLTASTALSSPANNDYAYIGQPIEGYRLSALGWGAAGAQSISYGFWMFSTVSGVAMMRVENGNGTRAYHRELTLAAGWNFLSGTIPGDTSGTWAKDNTRGMLVRWFAAGKQASPATPDVWSGTSALQTTGSTNLLANNGNVVAITGVYFAAGSNAPSAANLPNLLSVYDDSLKDALRQWWKLTPNTNSGPPITMRTGGASSYTGLLVTPVPMRANPAVSAPNSTLIVGDATATITAIVSTLVSGGLSLALTHGAVGAAGDSALISTGAGGIVFDSRL